MPKKFDECVEKGGKIRTINLSETKYRRICILPPGEKGPRGGRTVAGEIKIRKGD